MSAGPRQSLAYQWALFRQALQRLDVDVLLDGEPCPWPRAGVDGLVDLVGHYRYFVPPVVANDV